MVLMDTETVNPFVNGAIYALQIVQRAMKENDPHTVEVELHNAMGELLALQERLNDTNLDVLPPFCDK